MTKIKDIRNKVLSFDTPLTFKAADPESENSDLIIEGAASTIDKDRVGDIIKSEAWNEKALEAYKRNPIILAFHRHDRPIGKATEVKATKNGLQLKAKISKSAGDIYGLIKDNILSAFSVGFVVNDADYDVEKDIFLIKDVELLEVSVVSVPANPYTTFNVSKSFENSREFEEFKKSFIKEETPIEENIIMAEEKKVETKTESTPTVDVEALTAKIKAELKAEREAEAAAKAAEDAKRIEMRSMVEELVKQATAAVEAENAEKIQELKSALKDKEDEVAQVVRAARENKMSYSENSSGGEPLSPEEKDHLALLNLIHVKGRRDRGYKLEDTKYFQKLRQKSDMQHWQSGMDVHWEEELSTRVHNEMREELVVERLFTSIPMNTPTMYMPVNPDAGYGEWILDGVSPNASSVLRSEVQLADEANAASSTGSAVDHELLENSISAYKLVTKEFIGYEEEEDSIVPLLPIIRDAMARRMAKSADLALLRGPGTSGNPITGLESLGSSVTDVSFSFSAVSGSTDLPSFVAGSTAFENNFVDARKNLGIYGLDPSSLVWLVSHELYYEMMKLSVFKTIDQIGSRATLITGQVGAIFGTPVVVSQHFNNSAITAGTVGTTLGILCRPSNFVIGNLRNTLVESFQDVYNQKRGLVISRRFGFKDLDVGQGVVKFQFAS